MILEKSSNTLVDQKVPRVPFPQNLLWRNSRSSSDPNSEKWNHFLLNSKYIFSLLDQERQRGIAEEMDRGLSEVSKKLEDIRTRYAF